MFIVDWLKDMIVIGGENVYLKEVEDVFGVYLDIVEVVVVGVLYLDWGEMVVVYVVMWVNVVFDVDVLCMFCGEWFVVYKILCEFMFV